MRDCGKLLTLLAFVALVTARAGMAADKDTKVRELFKEGLQSFELEQYDKAKAKFEEIVRLNPGNALAARLRNEAGKILFRMMATEKTRRGAEELLKRARRHDRDELLKKRDLMAKLVHQALTDQEVTEEDRWAAVIQLVQLGQFALPDIIDYLKDKKHDDIRTHARVVVTKIGPPATLALIEALNLKEDLMKQNAALILADLNDYRAVPALKRIAEDEKEPEEVKVYARRSLEAITGDKVENLESAVDLYYALANRYYLNDASVEEESDMMEGVLWMAAKDNQVTYRRVPRYAWNELMAEEACYDAYRLKPDYERAVPLLLCIEAAQITEVEDLQDVAKDLQTEGVLDEEEVAEINTRHTNLRPVQLLVNSGGVKFQFRALRKALDDKRPLVAVALIDMLKDITDGSTLPAPGSYPYAAPATENAEGAAPVAAAPKSSAKYRFEATRGIFSNKQVHEAADPGEYELKGTTGDWVRRDRDKGAETTAARPAKKGGKSSVPPGASTLQRDVLGSEGSPLVDALNYFDPRVRYHAACTLAQINPLKNFLDSERVVPILGRALAETGPANVLVVEPDPDNLRRIKGALEAVNMFVSHASTAQEGFFKALAAPPKDAILISANAGVGKTSSFGAAGLFEKLKATRRTQNIPVAFVVATRKDADHPADALLRAVKDERTGEVTKGLEDELMAINDRRAAEGDTPLSIGEGKGYRIVHRTYPLSETELKDTARAMVEEKQSRAGSTFKMEKEEISALAAQALAAIDVHRTHLTVMDALEPLVATLNPQRANTVRNPALQALGHLGKLKNPAVEEKALAQILNVFVTKDSHNDKPIRINCLYAAGEINPNAERSRKVLLDALQEEDFDINAEAAKAVGKGNYPSNVLLDYMNARRIQRALKEPETKLGTEAGQEAVPAKEGEAKPAEGEGEAKPAEGEAKKEGEGEAKPKEGEGEAKPKEGEGEAKPKEGEAKPAPKKDAKKDDKAAAAE